MFLMHGLIDAIHPSLTYGDTIRLEIPSLPKMKIFGKRTKKIDHTQSNRQQ